MTIIHEMTKEERNEFSTEIGCSCGWRYTIARDILRLENTFQEVQAVWKFHRDNPDTAIDDDAFGQMPYVGMTPIMVTCKECDWVCSIEKVSDVSGIVRDHRILHIVAKRNASNRRRTVEAKALQIEEKIKAAQTSIDFLSNADKTLESLHREVLRLSEELESLRS